MLSTAIKANVQSADTPLRRFDGIICFGGEDWWYHNRGHYDMQMMGRLSEHMPVLYVNSIGMRTPSPTEGRMFLHRVRRKLRSIRRGLVEQDSESHRYRLGLGILKLSSALHRRLDLRERSRSLLRGLATETRETSHLGVLDGDEVVVVEINPGYVEVVEWNPENRTIFDEPRLKLVFDAAPGTVPSGSG